MTRILGISAFYHDSAACLVEDGQVVAALQEERFTRKKHDSEFPQQAIETCLKIGSCSANDLDFIVFYEKPFTKFERLLDTYLSNAPRGLRSYQKAIPLWIKDKLWIKDHLRKKLESDAKILFSEHHESHAASAFFPSPFESAAVFTIDGVGEKTTTSLGRGKDNQVTLIKELVFPDSLGLLYSTFTYYVGFKVNSGEYKLMGLAPYGKPTYEKVIRDHLIEINKDGSFSLNAEYFNYQVGLEMASDRFIKLFKLPVRQPGEPLTQQHQDLAASIQRVTEDVVLRMAGFLHQETGESNLCMAGGVALNCVANGRIWREGPFKDIWVQPASGDAGGALGAALAVWNRYLGKPRASLAGVPDHQMGSLLGTSYSDDEIEQFLLSVNAVYHRLSRDLILKEAAAAMARQEVVGWFQGRMEFGPRALGNRSILADPRHPDMLDSVNLRIKYRESFRPFAPAVLEERASEYFELNCNSPYMLLVAQVKPSRRTEIPAVTHVDGSARVQTVDSSRNPVFYSLLKEFESQSGCPVVLNTSFNVRGEPIVESPDQAYRCFMRTGMDLLVLGSFMLRKKEQPSGL